MKQFVRVLTAFRIHGFLHFTSSRVRPPHNFFRLLQSVHQSCTAFGPIFSYVSLLFGCIGLVVSAHDFLRESGHDSCRNLAGMLFGLGFDICPCDALLHFAPFREPVFWALGLRTTVSGFMVCCPARFCIQCLALTHFEAYRHVQLGSCTAFLGFKFCQVFRLSGVCDFLNFTLLGHILRYPSSLSGSPPLQFCYLSHLFGVGCARHVFEGLLLCVPQNSVWPCSLPASFPHSDLLLPAAFRVRFVPVHCF